jgi:hypothetical protein
VRYERNEDLSSKGLQEGHDGRGGADAAAAEVSNAHLKSQPTPTR